MAKRDYYVEPRWAEEGMTVFLPWDTNANEPGVTDTGALLRCKVAVAAGHHVRIVNQAYGVDGWYKLTSLYVPPSDLHA